MIYSYDNIGNPLSIGNKVLNWTNGRQLESIVDDTNTISYEYNKDGIRTKKIVNGVETNYYLENNNIIFEESDFGVIYYKRDLDNHLIGFRYNYQNYYYIKNAQEDIIGIMDSNYNVIAKYYYDAYGKVIAVTHPDGSQIHGGHVARLNAFRYRSYYYDEETELYYLNSRYYNPEFGRFINADTVIAGGDRILLSNMFAYGENNPIMNVDVDGNFAIAMIITGVAIVAGTVHAIDKMVEHHNTKGTIGFGDWVRCISEGAQRAAGIMSLGMTAQSAYDAASFSYNAHKVQTPQPAKNVQSVSNSTTKVHGNSLSTTKPAGGYVLTSRKNGSIQKYGETTLGFNRYTKKFLNTRIDGGLDMTFLAQGTKKEMHEWQHNMIIDYKNSHNGKRPDLNFNDW